MQNQHTSEPSSEQALNHRSPRPGDTVVPAYPYATVGFLATPTSNGTRRRCNRAINHYANGHDAIKVTPD